LRALLKNELADDWYKFLPQVLYAMRTRTCTVTKMNPYKLVFGRDPAQPLDLIFGRPPDTRDREPDKYVLEMRKRLDPAQSWARTNIGKYIRRKERRYNAEKKVFQTGVKVWLCTPVVYSSTKRKLSNYWSGPWTVEEKLTDLLYRIVPHNEWQTWMKVQVVGIDRLKLYREKKDENESDPSIVEPPRQDSLEYPDDKFLLDWEDGAEGVEDPDMPYYLGERGGCGQPPPPPPPPPGPQGGGGRVPAHAPVVEGAGQEGVAPGALPPHVRRLACSCCKSIALKSNHSL
jgi:hypothetical protein